MQDRFKCRVWDKDAKEYLTLYKEDEKTGMHSYWIGWDNSGVYQYDRDVEKDIVYVTDISQFVEIEQCTGVKDESEDLIYENDIVELDDGTELVNAVIEWDNNAGCWNIRTSDTIYTFDNLYGNEMRVIGNIHENADLLENKDE